MITFSLALALISGCTDQQKHTAQVRQAPLACASLTKETEHIVQLRSLGQRGGGSRGPTSSSPELMRAFIVNSQRVNNRIDTTSVTEEDNARIEREVADYRARVERMTDGRYDSMPTMQKQAMLQGLRQNFDAIADTTDSEIEYAMGLIAGIGKADAAYNYLIVHDAYLFAGERLFPEQGAYLTARAKVAAVLNELGGSRAGARAAEEAAEIAAAKKVRMPSATTTDPSVIGMFRRAWATGGIPWTILKINPTSGWYDKLEYGRVIGHLRDAAIAAQDPENAERCNLYSFTMFKDLSGNVRRSSHTSKRIACENVV